MNSTNQVAPKGSKRIARLTESQTIMLTQKVRDMRAEGLDVIGLTLGEPDFDTPVHIRNAGIEAIRESFTHYPPVPGIPELREAIAEKFRKENNLDFQSANVMVSTGAKQSLVNVIMALTDVGEEGLLLAPYWVSYYAMYEMAGLKIKALEASFDNDFKVTPEALDEALSPETRIMIINSPNNPCGAMYSEAEMRALAEVIERYPNLYVIVDEIYEYLSYDIPHFSLGSIDAIRERVITINGVSKGYAMTGWRIGFMGAEKWITKLCNKYQGQITSGACSISQRAAYAAVTGDRQPTIEMREQFRKRRDFALSKLNAIDGVRNNVPPGAFYVYPDLAAFFGKSTPSGQSINNIDEMSMYLLQEGHIAVVPGSACGTDRHVRLSYACDLETLEKGLNRISESLAALK